MNWVVSWKVLCRSLIGGLTELVLLPGELGSVSEQFRGKRLPCNK